MNPPKGYRHCVVGETFPASGVIWYNILKREFESITMWTGCTVNKLDAGFFFFKKEKVKKSRDTKKNVWTKTPTDIFNEIFPVEDMDFEESQGYLAAIIERKFTQEEFTKLCEVMNKERSDAVGENEE